jgi:hypothetical protein
MNLVMPLRRAFGPALGFLDGIAARRPVATSMAVTAGKAGAADVFVQTYVEQQAAIEPRRTATFALFGFSYQGCFQYVIINKVRQTGMASARPRVLGPHIWPRAGLTICGAVRPFAYAQRVGLLCLPPHRHRSAFLGPGEPLSGPRVG